MNYSNLFDIGRKLYTSISYKNKYGKAIIPLRYFLELTYRCNLKCPFCYVGDDRNKQELTTDEWKNVIKQIPFYGIITLVGGEPFLRTDFPEILEYASKKVFRKVHIVTNGTVLNDNIIASISKNKPVFMRI